MSSSDKILEKYFQEIKKEYIKSKDRFPPFANLDHAFGTLSLKLDDLKDELKKHNYDYQKVEHELIQIANIALRSLTENIEPYYQDLKFEQKQK